MVLGRHFGPLSQFEALCILILKNKIWLHLWLQRGYNRDNFKPNMRSLWPFYTYFLSNSWLFLSKIVIFEGFGHPFFTFLLIKSLSLNIPNILKSYWWEKSLTKLLNFDTWHFFQNGSFGDCLQYYTAGKGRKHSGLNNVLRLKIIFLFILSYRSLRSDKLPLPLHIMLYKLNFCR